MGRLPQFLELDCMRPELLSGGAPALGRRGTLEQGRPYFAERFIGIEYHSADPAKRGSGEPHPAEADGFIQSRLVIAPEFAVAVAAQNTHGEEVVILGQQAIPAELNLITAEEVCSMIPDRQQERVIVGHQIPAHRAGQRSGGQSFESQNLMNKAEVTVLQQSHADFAVCMEIRFVEERWLLSHEVGAIKNGIRRTEDIQVIEKHAPANLPARYHRLRDRQPLPGNAVLLESVGPDDSNGGILLCKRDHLFNAAREEPVVGKNHFGVSAVRGDLAQSMIVIGNDRKKLRVIVNLDSRIFGSIAAGNVEGSVGAAIVDDCVIPMRIGLRQHALYALGKVLRIVIEGRNDANQGKRS
jgi:hypothetical protein